MDREEVWNSPGPPLPGAYKAPRRAHQLWRRLRVVLCWCAPTTIPVLKHSRWSWNSSLVAPACVSVLLVGRSCENQPASARSRQRASECALILVNSCDVLEVLCWCALPTGSVPEHWQDMRNVLPVQPARVHVALDGWGGDVNSDRPPCVRCLPAWYSKQTDQIDSGEHIIENQPTCKCPKPCCPGLFPSRTAHCRKCVES